mgnify:CR=1 FL=1
MDRRRVFRNAFLWNALVSALMAGAALYARSGARGWLAAGWCIGVAASAAALACFCKAWAAAPDGTAVTGWYLLRVAAILAAVAGTAAFSMEGALGAILPQLAQGPLLAAAMLWEERREHKKDERPH